MPALSINVPFPVFQDRDGQPLENGYVYIGTPYLDPQTNPVQVYFDDALTIPAAQPLRTINGYVSNSGTPAQLYVNGVNFSIKVLDSKANLVYSFPDGSGISPNASGMQYDPAGVGAVSTTVQAKLRETVSVKDFGAVGDGVTDDTAAIQAAINSLQPGSTLIFPPASAYKITNTIEVFDKGRVTIDFGGQLINAVFASPKVGIHFKGIPQSRIGGIFLIGDTTNVSTGVLFDSDADSVTIHAYIGKIHVSQCNIGIMIGNSLGYQFSDSSFEDIYGADCNIGIYFTGENTLAMYYQRVAAYNNNNYGVIFEQGGGTIASLQSADSGYDLYFGSTAGTNHKKLHRWDILGGYSEEGANGEIFIGSSSCSDGNFFREEIVIKGMRVTPFTSTNVQDFVRWNLNGDLIFENCTFTCGTQYPQFKQDANGSYRAPRIIVRGVLDINPNGAADLPFSYFNTSNKQQALFDVRVNNGVSYWQNNGSINEGTIKRGIYTEKIKNFEKSLLAVGGLIGAWNLTDLTSNSCANLVLGGPNLNASSSVTRRDVWLDDGLVGFIRSGGTTSKTVSTTSSVYSAASEYTFGAILRATTSGTTEENLTNIGGTSGMRIALYNGALLCLVGAANAFNGSANAYDPHIVIGRYISGTSIKVDATNLRTGDKYSATTSVGVPVFGSLTWSNGLSFRNDVCVRGFPFVYNRSLTDAEVSGLMQSALILTDSWKLA